MNQTFRLALLCIFMVISTIASAQESEEESFLAWLWENVSIFFGYSTGEESAKRVDFEEITNYKWFIQRMQTSDKQSAKDNNATLKKVGDQKRNADRYMIILASIDEREDGMTIDLELEFKGEQSLGRKVEKLVKKADETYLSNTYANWEEVDEALDQMEINLRQSILEEMGLDGSFDPSALVYDYFVSDKDAWRRMKEPPYDAINPSEEHPKLDQGIQVAIIELVEDDKKKEVAKLVLKKTGEIVFTTLKNVTQVKNFPKERNYKLIKDFTALEIPFTGHSTEKVFKSNDETSSTTYFGKYVKAGKEGEELGGHWIAKDALIWTDEIEKEDFLSGTKDATSVGTKFKGNETSAACNVCVRSALLILRDDRALFPLEGSAFYDPENGFDVSYIKGYITNHGKAKQIKEDFDVISSKVDLNLRFSEIKKGDDEGLEAYFKRLQDKADAGGIVIGTMLNSDGSSGHVIMITPGGLVEIEENTYKWGESFTRKSRNIINVPRVLECGSGARNNEAPLCRNVDYIGATKRLKWFEYRI